MAHIHQINDADADGPLRRVYDAAKARFGGRIANIIKVMSLDGATTEASMDFYVALMKSPNALSPRRREMLAAVVSNINDCFY